jgi:hypothetical protein
LTNLYSSEDAAMISFNESVRRWSVRGAVFLGALAAYSAAVRLPDAAAGEDGSAAAAAKHFVRVSPRDPRYFELTDGRPYVPVGFNLVGAPQPDEIERVVDKMARHGVNYCRIWLDQKPWSVEQRRSGEYDAEAARHLDRFLALCRGRGIRVKMCVEFFRSIPAAPRDPKTGGKGVWSDKPLHHVKQGGYYESMTDFLNSERGRVQFKKKLAWYADRYKDEPAVFAWELWNEMNAVQGPWEAWTREMLPELHRLFPRNLAVQSLGSFDRDGVRGPYRTLCAITGNDVQQVHRYLDLGADLTVCHGPIDVLAADAVAELRAFNVKKPVILTETGAVKPRHTGASELYAKDKAGVLLHDMLFVPFFSGAAGPGHVWFWREAIDGPDHWRQFARFNRAIEGLDPPAEEFRPATVKHPRLRVYALVGKRTVLTWCRDAANDWQRELIDGRPPETLTGLTLDVTDLKLPFDPARATVRIYDPWQDRWSPAQHRGATITLPAFQRAVVVQIRMQGDAGHDHD